MVRALLERWWRWGLSWIERLAARVRGESPLVAPIFATMRRCDAQMERASRRMDKVVAKTLRPRSRRDRGRVQRVFERAERQIAELEAEANRPVSQRRSGPGPFERAFRRAERHVQAMVDDASRPRFRRPRAPRPHREAVAEMERRLDVLNTTLAFFEVERDDAAERAVEWHRLALLAKRFREKSLVREALRCRCEHEYHYMRCAREARKQRAILDEMRAAAETIVRSAEERG